MLHFIMTCWLVLCIAVIGTDLNFVKISKLSAVTNADAVLAAD